MRKRVQEKNRIKRQATKQVVGEASLHCPPTGSDSSEEIISLPGDTITGSGGNVMG